MLEGQRIVTFLQGAEMEDGENGAKRLWNCYTLENMTNFLRKNNEKHEKVLEMGREKTNRALATAFGMIFLR